MRRWATIPFANGKNHFWVTLGDPSAPPRNARVESLCGLRSRPKHLSKRRDPKTPRCKNCERSMKQ